MSVLAIRRIPAFQPVETEENEEEVEKRSFTIGAHADYSRDDFIFPRMQSREMRETPWGARAKPMKSWGEIAGVWLLFGLVSCALVFSATLI